MFIYVCPILRPFPAVTSTEQLAKCFTIQMNHCTARCDTERGFSNADTTVEWVAMAFHLFGGLVASVLVDLLEN